MKIGYLCADRGIPVLGHKGASVHVREMVTAFTRIGHDVTLFCTQRGEGNPPPPGNCIELKVSTDPDELTRIAAIQGLSKGPYDRKLKRELECLAHDRALPSYILDALRAQGKKLDLLYERYSLFHRAGIEVASSLSIPHILEINAPLVDEQARFRGLQQRKLAERIESEVFNRADHIIAVSEAMKIHALKQGVPASRISVLPNGVDTARFHPGIDSALIRSRHNLSDHPVIGFVGSLKPWHGLDLLFDAFIIVQRQFPQARLLIVGDGPVMEGLRQRVAKEDMEHAVVLAGHVLHGEIPAYLAAMDVTVAPYQPQQDFYFSPMKVVESMAAGRPVIAPRIGQLSELVEDGVTGRLYPPGDKVRSWKAFGSVSQRRTWSMRWCSQAMCCMARYLPISLLWMSL